MHDAGRLPRPPIHRRQGPLQLRQEGSPGSTNATLLITVRRPASLSPSHAASSSHAAPSLHAAPGMSKAAAARGGGWANLNPFPGPRTVSRAAPPGVAAGGAAPCQALAPAPRELHAVACIDGAPMRRPLLRVLSAPRPRPPRSQAAGGAAPAKPYGELRTVPRPGPAVPRRSGRPPAMVA